MKRQLSELIIISGLSGSGKSVALQSLEDIGYYCIDNLPAVLLPELSNYLPTHTSDEYVGAAISIDSRNKHFLETLDQELKDIKGQGRHYRILYLESDESILVRRFSETRRKHPLTDDATPLLEGIRLERMLISPLHQQAEKVIDSSETTPHELRGLVRDFAGGGESAGPLLLFESFGFKYGSPREADFVFDVRSLPNPHWEKELRTLTGLDGAVKTYLEAFDEVEEMALDIFKYLEKWLPGFINENRSYITVGIGCTGGQHRSVFISEKIAGLFPEEHMNVQVRHRELNK